MISKKVMKTEEFDNSIYYRLLCGCGSKDHDVTLEFEHDEKIPEMIFLNMYLHKNAKMTFLSNNAYL